VAQTTSSIIAPTTGALRFTGYQPSVNNGTQQTLVDTHDGFWTKQWQRIREREKKQYLESLEVVRDEIQELDEQIIEVQQVKVTKRIKSEPAFDPSEFYAEQMRIVKTLIGERQRLIDEEDETILLLM
jgi:FMN phosphatase YigB (HAD superfamily)